MDTTLIIKYLSALRDNNDREWFHEHKAAYQTAAREFEELLQQLIFRLGEFDSTVLKYAPKELTFKLNRDTRFSHDKSPYNPAFRAHIGPQGKLPIPVGYYLMLKPDGNSFLGGGLFTDMFSNATALIREYLAHNPTKWTAIITEPAFSSRFTVQGAALKRIPSGYDPAHPLAEYLKYKSWYLEYPISDHELQYADTFLDLAVETFRAMKPFNEYLNCALSKYEMPIR